VERCLAQNFQLYLDVISPYSYTIRKYTAPIVVLERIVGR
jgi:hypothetical protein